MLMRFLVGWAANAVALYVAAALLTGIAYGDSGWTLVVAAAVFTLVNMWLRPVVRLLSLPFIILTLGPSRCRPAAASAGPRSAMRRRPAPAR